MLSFILDSGEYVGPIQIDPPQQPWHIGNVPDDLKDFVEDIVNALNDLHIVYYRPFEHMPALRLEVAKSVATNQQRLAILFESMRIQCGAPGIMEPYPLYMADRMVKHLGTALPALRRITTQEIALKWENSLGNMYLAMHGYRTEWGR